MRRTLNIIRDIILPATFNSYSVVFFFNSRLLAIAIGGFFTIPSPYSFLWAMLLVPLSSLVILFLRKFLGYFIEIEDLFPLHIIRKNKLSLWLHDIAAPFYQYLKVQYSNKPVWSDSSVNPARLQLSTHIFIHSFKSKKAEGSGIILLAESKIKEFSFESFKTKIWAQSSDILP